MIKSITHTRGVVDLSSLIWTSLRAGKDKENLIRTTDPEGTPVEINGWLHGYENAVKYMCETMAELKLQPRDLIFVIEGQNSKALRRFIHNGYKAGRDKVPEEYEQFNLCKEAVLQAFLNVGAQACSQDGLEGDDVLGYLAANLKSNVWIISGDKDLAQCIVAYGERQVHHYRAGVRDENPFGPFDWKFIPTYIALVGDTGDKIPGAPRFGFGAFSKVMEAFGVECLPTFEQLIKERRLAELQEDVPVVKELQKVIDNAEWVYKSYEMGRLHLEKVNTLRRPLNWRVGMVKPRREIADERLRQYGGVNKIISAENFEQALAWAAGRIGEAPYVSTDIETSTPPESDDWLAAQRDGEGRATVDVFGSVLTSLQMTFGPNMQFTVYLPVDNIETEGCTNLTVDQVKQFLELVPTTKPHMIQNVNFELPVLANAMTFDMAHPWYGFLPNALDTKIMSSYVDENESTGLKQTSKRLLGYEQASYDDTVTKCYMKDEYDALPLSSMKRKGKVLEQWVEPVENVEWVKVHHKMNELTAKQVLAYGADDTICTAAVASHNAAVMEIEGTWDAFMEYEQFPSYLVAKSFNDGVDFDLEAMAEMEKEDNETYDKAWVILRQYLMDIGYPGTIYEPITELNRETILRAVSEVTGLEMKVNGKVTMTRTPAKLAKILRDIVGEAEDAGVVDDRVPRGWLLANMIDANDVEAINKLVEAEFKGEPSLNLGSPTQMAELLYDRIGIPVRILNDLTPLEKKDNPRLDDAVRKFKAKRAGRVVEVTEEDLKLCRKKVKSDDTAIQTAIAFDRDSLTDADRAALEAAGDMKTVMTRKSLYYKNYWSLKHWKDGKIHAGINQCGTVTRRFSSSGPNLQQLPKKGEGVKFRGCFLPHRRDAVVISVDYSGQELRLAAERSQDPNMLACYVGENLKDIHSLTAAFAMRLKWGAQAVVDAYGHYMPEAERNKDNDYLVFLKMRKDKDDEVAAKKADDLRKDSKNVNFTAQFGGGAPKIADRLIMQLTDAMLFLQARAAMFPLVEVAAKLSEEFCRNTGYALTLGGARRHLGKGIVSADNSEAARAARQAWNMEIQGSAGEMSKGGMARLWLSGVLFRLDVRFMMPVHDELVSSARKDHALEYIKIKHECMTSPYANMKVPILGSISLGKNFASQIECGDWFIEDNIKAALDKIFKKETA